MNLKKNRTGAGGIRADPVRQRLLAVFRKKSESRAASTDGNHGGPESL